MSTPRWLSEPQQRAWRGYLALNTQLSAELNRQLQAGSDLSLADFEVLVQLTESPEGRVRSFQLSRALQWEKSRLSHHVSRMQRRGLVRREGCPSDGRGAFVVITPEGRRAIEAAAPGHVETVNRLFFDVLTDDQVATLSAISEQVLSRLDDAA